MARRIHSFTDPDRFVVGTVGLPGERTFFLQARSGSLMTAVSLEKAQVALLADRLATLLGALRERGALSGASIDSPDDNEPLAMPLEEEFRAGALGLGWDEDRGRVVVEAHALDPEREPADVGEDDPEAPDTLRVLLAPESVPAFIRRANALVAAGRPPCPFCLQPLDASGHLCPRANGYRRRE